MQYERLTDAFSRADNTVTFLGITVHRLDRIVIINDPNLYRGDTIFEFEEQRDADALALFLSQGGDPVTRGDAALGLTEFTGRRTSPKCVEYAVSMIRNALEQHGSGVIFQRRNPRFMLDTVPADKMGWGGKDYDRGYRIQIPPGPGERGYVRPRGLQIGCR